MDPRDIAEPYRDFSVRDNYFEAPDLTRRLPIHDEYLLSREPHYPSPRSYHNPEGIVYNLSVSLNLLIVEYFRYYS